MHQAIYMVVIVVNAHMKIGKKVVKGGIAKDETQNYIDDGKGWVWFAADMSLGGLAFSLMIVSVTIQASLS